MQLLLKAKVGYLPILRLSSNQYHVLHVPSAQLFRSSLEERQEKRENPRVKAQHLLPHCSLLKSYRTTGRTWPKPHQH